RRRAEQEPAGETPMWQPDPRQREHWAGTAPTPQSFANRPPSVPAAAPDPEAPAVRDFEGASEGPREFASDSRAGHSSAATASTSPVSGKRADGNSGTRGDSGVH